MYAFSPKRQNILAYFKDSDKNIVFFNGFDTILKFRKY